MSGTTSTLNSYGRLERGLLVHAAGRLPGAVRGARRLDVSLLHVAGEWQWLVRCDGHDIAEGAALSVPDWHQRLVCSACDSRQIDFVVSGAKPD
jgi:hypothetical protein